MGELWTDLCVVGTVLCLDCGGGYRKSTELHTHTVSTSVLVLIPSYRVVTIGRNWARDTKDFSVLSL